ncbi:MAG TPA: hypothetical protein VM755_03585 [Stellaceae bacterium]|nr:hypothetical protein [Stellaceae bacterium]
MFKAPEFVRLRDVCASLYLTTRSASEDAAALETGLEFALSHALDSLGLPGRPSPADRHLALPAGVAAARLHAAFQRRKGRRLYLCPLDKADSLPDLTFGPNRIARFTAVELEKLVDLPRLRRISSAWAFDARRFSQFMWLTIEKTYSRERAPSQRAIPWLFEPPVWPGAIEPHRRWFPIAVENALLAMLLAPWEDWTVWRALDWRGFEMPWVYEIDDDLFVRPLPPPSPDSLSWEPPALDDDGEEVSGTEEPERRALVPGAEVSAWLNESRWTDAARALQSPLFETPIAHFFVKTFLEDPLDEFLAHITAIEAALGLQSDYRRGATKLVAQRVATLLGEQDAGRIYHDLFNLRCAFLHGRNMDTISSEQRIGARRLARRVVDALARAVPTLPQGQSREDFLNNLWPR